MVNWDKRYAEAATPLFGGQPNTYVIQTLARPDVTARTALCLADGDGRNGRYLALQGITVTAVDISSIATRQALELDAAAGVIVERTTGDLASWQPAPNQRFDAIFLIYLHCERDVRQRAVRLASRHLPPGGWFVAEGFAAEFAEGPRMGPPDPALRYTANEFTTWLGNGFGLVEALEGTVELHEGTKHQGQAQIVRYTARRL